MEEMEGPWDRMGVTSSTTGRLLLIFAVANKLAILNSFFDKRKAGYGKRSTVRQTRMRSDLTKPSRAGPITAECLPNVVVIPQPERPAKPDSDHNMGMTTVDLSC